MDNPTDTTQTEVSQGPRKFPFSKTERYLYGGIVLVAGLGAIATLTLNVAAIEYIGIVAIGLMACGLWAVSLNSVVREIRDWLAIPGVQRWYRTLQHPNMDGYSRRVRENRDSLPREMFQGTVLLVQTLSNVIVLPAMITALVLIVTGKMGALLTLGWGFVIFLIACFIAFVVVAIARIPVLDWIAIGWLKLTGQRNTPSI